MYNPMNMRTGNTIILAQSYIPKGTVSNAVCSGGRYITRSCKDRDDIKA